MSDWVVRKVYPMSEEYESLKDQYGETFYYLNSDPIDWKGEGFYIHAQCRDGVWRWQPAKSLRSLVVAERKHFDYEYVRDYLVTRAVEVPVYEMS